MLTLANLKAKLTLAGADMLAKPALTVTTRARALFWARYNSQQTVTKQYTNHFCQLRVATRSSLFTASLVKREKMNTRVSGAGAAAEEEGDVLPVSNGNMALARPLTVLLTSQQTPTPRGLILKYQKDTRKFPIHTDVIKVFFWGNINGLING